MNLRETINSSEEWIVKYLSQRKDYPEWVTRDGKHIKVEDITDSHLSNLLNFLPKGNVWYKVFMCEKKYRNIMKRLPEWKKENLRNEEIMQNCF